MRSGMQTPLSRLRGTRGGTGLHSASWRAISAHARSLTSRVIGRLVKAEADATRRAELRWLTSQGHPPYEVLHTMQRLAGSRDRYEQEVAMAAEVRKPGETTYEAVVRLRRQAEEEARNRADAEFEETVAHYCPGSASGKHMLRDSPGGGARCLTCGASWAPDGSVSVPM
jgi:hypothetical protein